MFGFLKELMNNTHDERKVMQYSKDELFIDTCAINDSDQPYETAISHPNYNNDKLVIVEMYSTKKEALEGHRRWVKIMTAKKLPDSLKDVSTSDVISFARALGVELNEEYVSDD